MEFDMNTKTKIQNVTVRLAKQRPLRVAPVTGAIHPDSLIRLHQILGTRDTPPLLSIGRTTFYRLISEGKLPQPRKLGGASLWRAGDILAALETL